jgi:signal transduction histidine kinase/ActR/RegA family two-component response regulator
MSWWANESLIAGIQERLAQGCRALELEAAVVLAKGQVVAGHGPDERQAAMLRDLGNTKSNGAPGVWPIVVYGETAGSLLTCGASRRGEVLASLLAGTVERSQLQERVTRLERVASLGELVYHVAHELNNPLTSVAGFADLLADRVRTPANSRIAERLRAEAHRTLGIARNILALSRLPDEKRILDLNAVVRQALAMREYALGISGIRVESDLASGLPPVEGIAGLLQQAILNVLINAEQALESHAGERWLRISTAHAAGDGRLGALELRVENSGPPIPPESLEIIFEPFYTTKPVGEGTGLGLALARSVLDAHLGSIRAENTPAGVAFHLEMPAAARPAAGRPEPAGATMTLRQQRLLLVEDEAPLAAVVKEFLAAEGCRVTVCRSAEEALRALAWEEFDIVISDLRMPGKGGQWLYEQIGAHYPRLAERTVFITGDTVSRPTASFLRHSGQPNLAKPFRLEELRRALAQLLARAVAVSSP